MRGMTDLHCHMLCKTDDGARNEAEMYEMLDMSYHDGIRTVCFTPHFNPNQWHNSPVSAQEEAFEKATAYAKKYPDLVLLRGNEFLFDSDMTVHLNTGACRTLNGSRYLLVDFLPEISYFKLRTDLRMLFGEGLRPVLAHTERYLCLYKKPQLVSNLMEESGAIIQINASSLFGEWGRASRKIAEMLLKYRLAQVVASDCHRKDTRKPGLSAAFCCVKEKYGDKMAWELFDTTPQRILHNEILP